MPGHLTREQRFRAMSRVKLKDGSLEIAIRSELHKRGYRFRKHVKALPGNPDAVFPREKVAVFINGDFWHGYRLPTWEHKAQGFLEAEDPGKSSTRSKEFWQATQDGLASGPRLATRNHG